MINERYVADGSRYNRMRYRRCGNSGLLLPEISLGLWQHFSDIDVYADCRKIILRAFDMGITHFDLANNYGQPAGSTETNFGRILKEDLGHYRDEMIITTKAGYDMWPGPYGEWGSRKYLIASLDQSLRRMGLDYVDIFYSHRPDESTPLEETMETLAHIVKQGKALYVGLSNYPPEMTRKAVTFLQEYGVRCLVHQPQYSMLNREPEKGLLKVLTEKKMGCVAFQPLAQGLLTNKYLNGTIPDDSRIHKGVGALKESQLNTTILNGVRLLDLRAAERGQTLAQMALVWLLKKKQITSVLVGASSVKQLEENVAALKNPFFSDEELNKIEKILNVMNNDKALY